MEVNPTKDITDEEVLALLDGSSDFPTPTTKDNAYKFFKQILNLEDSSKVANLKDEEIGKSRLSSRSYFELAAYSKAENLPIIESYFKEKAEILAKTSMGRKGFLAQLFVTQIKKEQKLISPKEKKQGFWSKKEPEGETQ